MEQTLAWLFEILQTVATYAHHKVIKIFSIYKKDFLGLEFWQYFYMKKFR